VRRPRHEGLHAAGEGDDEGRAHRGGHVRDPCRQYLAAIRPADGMLALETMYFADEVREPADEIDNLPARS
jgi:hypothetical protein